jgi:phage terminase large subunit GpA-like protein
MAFYEKHAGHEKHLCFKVSNKTTTLEEYKALVKDAKYLCKHCGRLAANAENLCDPIPL